MFISVRWLKEMISFEMTPEELCEHLTMAGLEVEETLDLGMGSGKIVVAEVLEATKHADADKLNVCRVDAGLEEPLQIICGAPNVRAGMKVPCALIGAVLPGDFKIKQAKIRGVESFGMLCSAKELGMVGDSSGIMELPGDWTTGEPFDYLIDIKITPNRPDCLNILGVAREVAARLGKKVFPPQPRVREMLDHIERYVDLSIKAREACTRYTCRLIKGVKIGPSPLWMQRAIEACGMRSINNVVDVTNYVLLELGHPLHAFDADTIDKDKVIVRMAAPGEKLTIIDGSELELCEEDLVIADASSPIALAGVMGGQATEVSEETTNILLESAYFEPGTIRKTARRYGLNTEASYRFERGTDRERVTLALNRAMQLIHELAGGEVAKGILDAQTTSPEEKPILLETEHVNTRLGLDLPTSDIANYLVGLDFEIRRSDRDSLIVVAPSHRVDIERPEDLIEEVARVHNYNNIPSTLPRITAPCEVHSSLDVLEERSRETLLGAGFAEIVSYSFVAERDAELFGFSAEAQPTIANPLTQDQVIMRPTLLAGLLTAAAHNQHQHEPQVMLFESDKVWHPKAEGEPTWPELSELAFLITGQSPAYWDGAQRELDFYDARGVVEKMVAQWGGGNFSIVPDSDCPYLHPGRTAKLTWRGVALGHVGEIHPDLAEAYDLRGHVYVATLNLSAASARVDRFVPRYEHFGRFPGTQRDLSLVVARDQLVGDLLETASKTGGKLVETVELFDVYEGEHIEADKKSVALRLNLRSMDKTLTDEEIQAVTDKVLKKLNKSHGAVLRS